MVEAARDAEDAGFDVLIACAFNFEAHASEFAKLGRIPGSDCRCSPHARRMLVTPDGTGSMLAAMAITPSDSESTPSGELAEEVDTGEPPPITSEVSIAPSPPPAAENDEAPTPPDDERSGTVRIGEVFDRGEGGRYTVKECLGRGGMGEVYRAECVTPDAKEPVQVFALKVLRADALPRHERTFIDEVHILSQLRHKRIAGYHDFFVDKGRQVLVMEYVEGRSLYSIIRLARRKGRTLSESTSLELLAQVADTLGYAHAAKDEDGCPLNIVHRDVSPSNIMVTSAGDAVLMDFGVAKADLEDRTQTGSDEINFRGKPAYLSPEQVQGLPDDGRSDLFSLGSLLVEMLTGEPPFGRSLRASTLFSIALVTPEYVDKVTRGLSEKVQAICRKALAWDPEQRFADGGEMAAAMLESLPSRDPKAVQEEIETLEGLPDAPPKTVERPHVNFAPLGPLALPDAPPEKVEREATARRDLRRVTRKRRALEAIGALACAAVACFFFWHAPMKPEASTPAVAEAAPRAPPRSPAGDIGDPEAAAMEAACLKMPGCVAIHTGTKAGDCYHPVQKHLFGGFVVPDVMYVALDESNPEGPCQGKWGRSHVSRDEPCPFYDKKEIIMRMTGDSLEERKWYGPGPDGPKPSLLIGETKVFDATGKYQSDFGHPLREYSQRMTALIKEIRTYDGHKVLVCGVLFGEDDKEGVPIFRSPKDGKPFGGAWGKAKVKFFWPQKKE